MNARYAHCHLAAPGTGSNADRQDITIGLPEAGTPGHVTIEREDGARARIDIHRQDEAVRLRLPDLPRPERLHALRTAIEALTAAQRLDRPIVLGPDDLRDGDAGLWDFLHQRGYVVPEAEGSRVSVPQFWQQPDLWLTGAPAGTYPQIHTLTAARRHPRRPPKPTGAVYRRHIPWLQGRISFRVVDVDRDLALFSRWMNDPRVAEVWEDDGPLEKHRTILEERDRDPHVLPLVGEFEGTPFGYFEVYWAKENRLGPHYDAEDYDRGWHVAIGEDAFRGRRWITAWLPSLMHFIFLDDARTMRIVGEPRASHHQQIRNLDKAGFAKVKHFDFPHKRALLVMLWRERFFAEHLWAPETAGE